MQKKTFFTEFLLTNTLEPACKVHGCKVFSDVRSIFGWSQTKSAIANYYSARFAGNSGSNTKYFVRFKRFLERC